MKNVFIILAIISSYSLDILGQNQLPTFYKGGSWFSTNIKTTFASKYGIGVETHIRRINFLKDWQQFLVRPYFSVKLKDKIVGSIGYTFIQNYPYTQFTQPIPTHEHNVWEQVELKHAIKKISFTHRYRLEQRFIQKVSDVPTLHTTTQSNFALRFRYRLSISKQWLIGKEKKRKFYLEFFNELWCNLNNSNFMISGFNQNWVYLGVKYEMNNYLKISLGYLNQTINHQNFGFENNSIVQLTLSSNIKVLPK